MQKVIIRGGLGNQLFQYAFYSYLKNAGMDVRMDISLYNLTTMHNGYELRRDFGINDPVINHSGLKLHWLRAELKIGLGVARDNSFENVNEYIGCRARILDGYWGKIKYSPFMEKLRNELVFHNINTANISLAEEMKRCESVSVHIRRGDYIGNPLFDGICTKDYYRRAVNYILAKVRFPVFYILSDDKEWSNDFFSKEFHGLKYNIVDFNNGADNYQDLFLMTQCRHNILANSTFSWWGHFLNSNNGKNGIAPKGWFKDEKFIEL